MKLLIGMKMLTPIITIDFLFINLGRWALFYYYHLNLFWQSCRIFLAGCGATLGYGSCSEVILALVTCSLHQQSRNYVWVSNLWGSLKVMSLHILNCFKWTQFTECPICGDPIEQPGSALMDNIFAEIDPNQADAPVEDTKYTCTACDEEREANSYCQQCEEWLCDSCVDAHKRVRITRDHVIIPKDQVSRPWCCCIGWVLH